jgi:hypothetical protein
MAVDRQDRSPGHPAGSPKAELRLCPIADVRRVCRTGMMRVTRTVWTAALGLAVASCSQAGHTSEQTNAEWQKAGWHYRFERGDDRGAALYRFSDRSKDFFVALCDRMPVFSLEHGAHDPLAKAFTLRIDQRTWTIPLYRDEHSDALIVDDPKLAEPFAHAAHEITFSVGGTSTVHLPPSPQLARLITECRKRNGSATNGR